MGIAADYLQPLKSIIGDEHFRTWLRLYYKLKSKPRKTEGQTTFDGFQVTYVDALSFIFQYKEIFVGEYYRFHSGKSDPLIIDCGANIGMCSLYFKKLYPQCRIIAFEADTQIADIFRKNIADNQLSDIQVFQKAVWSTNEGMTFYPNGADGGSFYGESNDKITVPTCRLREVLQQEKDIDFLKIDIEGAESDVIRDCNGALDNVHNMYIEYHSFADRKQSLGHLLETLEDNGFHYTIGALTKQPHPLIQSPKEQGMDFQLHIFANRRSK